MEPKIFQKIIPAAKNSPLPPQKKFSKPKILKTNKFLVPKIPTKKIFRSKNCQKIFGTARIFLEPKILQKKKKILEVKNSYRKISGAKNCHKLFGAKNCKKIFKAKNSCSQKFPPKKLGAKKSPKKFPKLKNSWSQKFPQKIPKLKNSQSQKVQKKKNSYRKNFKRKTTKKFLHPEIPTKIF